MNRITDHKKSIEILKKSPNPLYRRIAELTEKKMKELEEKAKNKQQ
jgi:hypothetical protein